jgi:hypothetical protein
MNKKRRDWGLARQALGAALGLCLTLNMTTARAVVVTFDDLQLAANDPIPDGYGGINWTTSPLIDFLWFPGASIDGIHPPPSPPGVAYPRNGLTGAPSAFAFSHPRSLIDRSGDSGKVKHI